MKSIIYILACSFFFSTAAAQQSDTAIASIHYTLRHMTDSAAPTVFREENMVTYIGNRMNIFLSYDKIKRDSALMKEKASGNNNATAPKPLKPVIQTQIVSNKNNHQLVVHEYLLRNYYYTMPYPDINWTITREKKQVAGYSCTKAEGYYKGRTYYAWFTTETKLQGAPWKLTGLPGLVLEAYDTRKQVIFEFDKIEMATAPNNSFIITTPPAYAIETTRKDFLRMREATWSDPVNTFNSNNPGIQLTVSTGNGVPANIRLPRPANPLELVDD